MNIPRFRFYALLVVLFMVPLRAQQGGLSPSVVEKIERAITAEMARKNIPGLSIAVVQDHQLKWSNGYGMSDLENFVPAKASTNYRLGSISKPITAVAVMQLVEQGLLDLDVPVQQYCLAFPRKQWLLTTRQLLSHIGGVRHYRSDEINSTKPYPTLIEGLEIFKDDTLLFEPGTRYSYTTYGYSVLGCVVEGVSGRTYVDFVKERIFKPAAMERIRVDDVNELIPNRAQGYQKMPDGSLKNSHLANTSYKIPGGGWCSTVDDLAKFAIALQTGKLVKQTSVDQMFTGGKLKNGQVVRTNPNNPAASYGLGWAINERNGVKEVSHSGGQQRVNTMLYMVPGKKFAVALMCNLEGAGLMTLAREIADAVLQQQ